MGKRYALAHFMRQPVRYAYLVVRSYRRVVIPVHKSAVAAVRRCHEYVPWSCGLTA
jgi:hypothetical protein